MEEAEDAVAEEDEAVEVAAEEEEDDGDSAVAVQPDPPVVDILSQPPTGEPLNPSRRGSAAWEPFLDEDPYEGLEVRSMLQQPANPNLLGETS